MSYISGTYTQGQLLKSVDQVEIALAQEFLTNGPITSDFYQKYWRDRVIDASFGRNTVLYDDLGNPSVMVIINANTKNLLDETKDNVVHPAFIVDGKVIPKFYVSKYLNTIVNDRPVSLKGLAPSNLISFTTANTSTKNKGNGWHVLTNAEYAAIALQSWDSGFFPRGNTDRGRSGLIKSERGIPADIDNNGKVRYTLNGTGPISWSHDGTPFGVFDLTGNLGEFVTGVQLVDRQIRIIPNNDAASPSTDITSGSDAWKSVLKSGALANPGSVGSLGYVKRDSGFVVVEDPISYPTQQEGEFKYMHADEGLETPDILKELTLFPKNADVDDGSRWYVQGSGNHQITRGGTYLGDGGYMTLIAENTRFSGSWTSVGFRTSFIEGL